jgi:putative membrane protein
VTTAGPHDHPDPPGLQAERTGLAWERTALAVLVNGALLVLRHLREPASGALMIAVAGFALAMTFVTIGASRARTMCAGRPVRPPRVSVPLVGITTILFGIAVAAALVVPAI